MKNKPAILIDVDLTIVDSGWPWLDWMSKVYQCDPDWEAIQRDIDEFWQYNYNLSEYFPSRCKKSLSPFDFWEDPFLYDKMSPLEGSVAGIEKLHSAGYPIRFVSYCKKGHFSSKVRFLKRNFPFMDLDNGTDGCGFYATKYKAGVDGGVIVDDRNKFLNQFGDEVLKVKFVTPFTQDEEPRVQYDKSSSCWGEITDFIMDMT